MGAWWQNNSVGLSHHSSTEGAQTSTQEPAEKRPEQEYNKVHLTRTGLLYHTGGVCRFSVVETGNPAPSSVRTAWHVAQLSKNMVRRRYANSRNRRRRVRNGSDEGTGVCNRLRRYTRPTIGNAGSSPSRRLAATRPPPTPRRERQRCAGFFWQAFRALPRPARIRER